MVAEFTGPSPHDLGTAELATVQVLENNIEMMLHLLDDWHRAGGSRADDAGGSARVGGAFDERRRASGAGRIDRCPPSAGRTNRTRSARGALASRRQALSATRMLP